MLGQPVSEGPPNRTKIITDALFEIDDQYTGIRDVLEKMYDTLVSMDKRLTAIERRLGK